MVSRSRKTLVSALCLAISAVVLGACGVEAEETTVNVDESLSDSVVSPQGQRPSRWEVYAKGTPSKDGYACNVDPIVLNNPCGAGNKVVSTQYETPRVICSVTAPSVLFVCKAKPPFSCILGGGNDCKAPANTCRYTWTCEGAPSSPAPVL